MNIRKSKEDDLRRIMEIYDGARRFMAENGNPGQWGDGYPAETLIREDIQKGQNFVCEEDGRIAAVFTFIIGADPTYAVIEEGNWRSEETYGTIHRLASDGSVRGIADACLSFCRTLCPYLRIDTHRDNLPMQRSVERFGFRYCGIIYVEDGSERLAYDYI